MSASNEFPTQPSDVATLLSHRAHHQPDRTAYIFLMNGETEESSLTYRLLDKRARTIAVQLQSLQAAGERALLLYPPGMDYIAAFFGCLYAGVIAVPAYPPHPARAERTLPRLIGIVRSARPSVALVPPSAQVMVESVLSGHPGLEGIRWLATGDTDEDRASAWQKPDVNEDTFRTPVRGRSCVLAISGSYHMMNSSSRAASRT